MGLSVDDCRAGTLVWVQRKNGSWWPARVLAINQLSPSHHPTHIKAAIPIKLLGREYARVDWYNVEKSKRIKPFRCGEFDACIERAKSYQPVFSKKIVKYAHREGAILHALELEKQQQQRKHEAHGEKRAGNICQAKRSRCVYLPGKSNNCGKRKAFHPELLHVSSSILEKHECPLQSGSAEDDPSSRSREVESAESDFRGPVSVPRETQLSGTQPRNSGTHDGQHGEMNKKQKGKENICNLTKRQGDCVYGTETTLTNVKLTVQASYRGEHAPLVSVMSMLNGKAIVGHLVDIEASNDDSSKAHLAGKLEHKSFDNNGRAMLQPAWRTSRRTPVCYVPQPHPPALKDHKNAQAYQNDGHLSLKARPNCLAPTNEYLRKSMKKPTLLKQKTRTLSSFDTEQKLRAISGYLQPDVLLGPKDGLPTRVTCVPVKQIFSKLLVAVSRAQS
ncbi:hypothetical protein U1Q18_019034 [Sarracenia purpurea var. burkii]